MIAEIEENVAAFYCMAAHSQK